MDFAATQFVHQQLLDRRDSGCAVLLISSELDELLDLSDRIGVLYEGKLTLTDWPRTGRETIGEMLAGVGLE